MHPTCPLGDAVCLGALGEPISGENVHTLVFWGHGSGNWDVKGLRCLILLYTQEAQEHTDPLLEHRRQRGNR